MSDEFAGQTAVITGGGSGIGKAIALRYAAGGGNIVVIGRRPEPIAETAAAAEELGVKARAVSCDVRQADQLTEAIDQAAADFGSIDALVNNAAGNFVCPAEDLSPGGWRAVVDIVLNGSFYATRAAGRHMLEQGKGAILSVIASYAWHGHPGTVHSAAAKGGVLAMTRTLASEWGGRGVRVNAISPGPTETEGAGAALWPTDADRTRVLGSVPAGRFTTPDEIAESAAFLLDPTRAAYINGATLSVDGGQWLGKVIYADTSKDQ